MSQRHMIFVNNMKGFGNKNRNNLLPFNPSSNYLSNNASNQNLESRSTDLIPYQHMESTTTQGQKWSKILDYLK